MRIQQSRLVPHRYVVVAAALAVGIGCAAPAAHALRLVEPSGEPLPTVSHKGENVTLGQLGQTYEIEITNGTQVPVAAMVSIDGVDEVGRRSPPFQPGARRSWRIRPSSYVRMPGYFVSAEQVSTFRFVQRAQSFGATQGVQGSVGKIQVAFFHLRPSRRRAPPAIDLQAYASREAESSPVPENRLEVGNLKGIEFESVDDVEVIPNPIATLELRYDDSQLANALGTAGPPLTHSTSTPTLEQPRETPQAEPSGPIGVEEVELTKGSGGDGCDKTGSPKCFKKRHSSPHRKGDPKGFKGEGKKDK